MERLYRVSRAGEPFFALEQDGVLRRAIPDGATIFDGYDRRDQPWTAASAP